MAFGIIIASVASYLIPLSLWTYGGIVFCAFGCDFDVFLKQYVKDGNHRNLFTHSLYPSVILLGIGLLMQKLWLVIAGGAYLVHLLTDTLDWGLNLFYTHRSVGLALLIHPEEKAHFQEVLDQQSYRPFFFPHRYYTTRWIQVVEIAAFLGMLMSIIVFAPQFWYFCILYFLALIFHLTEYREMRHRASGGSARIPLVPH